MKLSDPLKRYSRQVLLDWMGEEGQERLLSSRVAIAGCGALGSTSLERLARAGAGFIRVIDRDFVEMENLQRQSLFTEDDALRIRPKAAAAVEHARRINSHLEMEGVVADINPRTVLDLLQGADLVIDGLDNMETRLLINDACLKMGIPWIYGACVSTTGMTMNIVPGKGPCFRCLLDSPPPAGTLPTCDTVGILNTIPIVVSSIQVTEAIMILTGRGLRGGDLLSFDLSTLDFFRVRVSKRRSCPACGRARYDILAGEAFSSAVTLCGRNAVQIVPEKTASISFEELKKGLEMSGDGVVSFYGNLLKFVRGGMEMVIFPDGRAIIKGTTDVSKAKSFYSRYLGG